VIFVYYTVKPKVLSKLLTCALYKPIQCCWLVTNYGVIWGLWCPVTSKYARTIITIINRVLMSTKSKSSGLLPDFFQELYRIMRLLDPWKQRYLQSLGKLTFCLKYDKEIGIFSRRSSIIFQRQQWMPEFHVYKVQGRMPFLQFKLSIRLW